MAIGGLLVCIVGIAAGSESSGRSNESDDAGFKGDDSGKSGL